MNLNWSLAQVRSALANNPDLKCKEMNVLNELSGIKDVNPKGVILRKLTKVGWRDDLGGFFRSSWEANYARYLNFINEPFEYESQEYEFPLRRGNRFYKIDFYLPRKNEIHEVKGYMDKNSRIKLNRLRKYYPAIYKTLKIIGPEEYKAIEKSVKHLIPEWEGQFNKDLVISNFRT